MIKRLNDELNELINKNMLQMKVKRNDRTETVEDRTRLMEEERKNNETAIDRMDHELGKMQGREG